VPARNIEGLRVLVTGASSGIGYQIASQLAARGASVLATARRKSRLKELQSSLNMQDVSGDAHAHSVSLQPKLDFLAGDLTDQEHRRSLIAWIDSHWGGLDVLINNAGSGAIGRFDSANAERMRKVMEIDFFAPVELTRIALPVLKRGNRPAIMIIGSVLAIRAVPRKSEYCAAKFALRGWAEALRVELAKERIEVLQIHPSTTNSEFFDSLTDTPAQERSRSAGSMEPAKVAQHAISALVRSRREMILSPGGKLLVWASKRFPRLVDRILIRFG
jgi:short-subunit dehydrogenase